MKKRLPIIIIAVLVVVFAGLGFYSHQKSKIKYNTSYVNGNTAGNLYNARSEEHTSESSHRT